MSSGSFQVGTSNKYIVGTLSWQELNQNIGSNTSDVYFELRFSRTNTGYTTNGSGDFTVVINGTPVTISGKSFSLTYNSNTLVLSGTVMVPHNSDGTKQVLIEVDGNTSVFDVYYANSSPWLDTIPRASVFNGNIAFTAGVDNFWMSIDRKSTDFHHTVEMYVQHKNDSNWDLCGQRFNVGDSGWWNFSVAEITQIYTTLAQGESRSCLIRVYTYDSAGNQIGSYQDKIGTVYAHYTGVAAFNDFNIGDSVPASISHYNANFTYDVTLGFGSFSKSWSNVGQNFTMTFTQAEINLMYQQIPNDNRGFGTVTVRTKYNGVYIEDGTPDTHDKSFIAYVVNSNPMFTTIQYADTNATTTALTNNDQYIIQNKSTFQAKILNANKAVAKNYATMSKYVAILNGVSNTVAAPFDTDIVFNFGTINSANGLNLQITAYDSRGNGTTVVKAVNIVPYSPPSLVTSATRQNGFGATVTLSLSGSISPLNVNGVNKNSLVATGVNYMWRQVGGAWSAVTQFLGQTLTMPNFNTTPVTLTMDTTLAFEIQVQVTDKIGNTTVILPVGIGTPLVFIDEILKAIGVGKFPSTANSLDVAGNILSGGAIVVDSGSNANGSWVKFYDGTMICRTKIAQNVTFGGQQNFYWSSTYSWTFPVAFVGTNPDISHNNPHFAGGAVGFAQAWATGLTTASWIVNCAAQVASIDNLSLVAIGKWK